MNSYWMKYGVIPERLMLSEKAPWSAVLNFIALLYIVNCCMVIRIVSSIIIFLHQSIFPLIYCFLLGLFIVLCHRLLMLQRCRVLWDVVCPTCASWSGAAFCLRFPFALRRPRDPAGRAVLVESSWLAVAAGSAWRAAVELSGSCAWVEVSRTAFSWIVGAVLAWRYPDWLRRSPIGACRTELLKNPFLHPYVLQLTFLLNVPTPTSFQKLILTELTQIAFIFRGMCVKLA